MELNVVLSQLQVPPAGLLRLNQLLLQLRNTVIDSSAAEWLFGCELCFGVHGRQPLVCCLQAAPQALQQALEVLTGRPYCDRLQAWTREALRS
jgi:hypothetical protein